MIKYLQRLGKSLMLPVAALPVAGILMGIGYWIDPQAWGSGNIIAAFCLKAGGALIDNMALLFAIGVAVGMAKDKEGTSALAGLVSFLVFTTVLSTASVTVSIRLWAWIRRQFLLLLPKFLHSLSVLFPV